MTKYDEAPEKDEKPEGGGPRRAAGRIAPIVLAIARQTTVRRVAIVIAIAGIFGAWMVWRDLETKKPVSYSENLVVKASRLNCRVVPSIDATPLKKLDKGSVVTAVQLERVDGWVKLQIDGTDCWAKEEYLIRQSDESPDAVSPSYQSNVTGNYQFSKDDLVGKWQLGECYTFEGIIFPGNWVFKKDGDFEFQEEGRAGVWSLVGDRLTLRTRFRWDTEYEGPEIPTRSVDQTEILSIIGLSNSVLRLSNSNQKITVFKKCGSQNDEDLSLADGEKFSENHLPSKDGLNDETIDTVDEQPSLMLTCKPKFQQGDPVTISIDAKSWRGKRLSCIRTMAAEGETCAVNGGTSRLYPTGTARIQNIFERPNDVGGYPGNMISFAMSDRSIFFSGASFNGRDTWIFDWSFSVDRISGAAVLKVDGDNVAVGGSYTCVKGIQHF